jgi:hypothetical protein
MAVFDDMMQPYQHLMCPVAMSQYASLTYDALVLELENVLSRPIGSPSDKKARNDDAKVIRNAMVNRLNDMLADRIDSFIRAFIPRAIASSSYYSLDSVDGDPGDHLRIYRVSNGSRSIGNWKDFKTGLYGDLIDLYKHNTGKDTKGAMEDLVAWVGGASLSVMPKPRATKEEVNEALSKRRRKAYGFWVNATDIKGTIVERYHRRRGFPMQHMDNVRYHPAVLDPGTGQSYEAALYPIWNPAFRLVAVQRVLLHPDTPDLKAPVKDPKMMVGDIITQNGFFAARRHGENLIIGEGGEEGGALGLLAPRAAIRCVAACTMFPTLPVFSEYRRQRIAGHRDAKGEGEHFARQYIDRVRATDPTIDIELVMPPSGLNDWNDELQWDVAAGRQALTFV